MLGKAGVHAGRYVTRITRLTRRVTPNTNNSDLSTPHITAITVQEQPADPSSKPSSIYVMHRSKSKSREASTLQEPKGFLWSQTAQETHRGPMSQ